MGEHRAQGRPGVGSRSLTDVVARVVPGVPSFSVDDGFRYSIPDHLAERVRLGTLVRIPLGGRRVRGFVVGIEPDDGTTPLKPIAAISGHRPVFDQRLLEVLRWAARHYVAPVAALLERAAPPNNPPAPPRRTAPPERIAGTGVFAGPVRSLALLSTEPPIDAIAESASGLLEEGRSSIVVTPTAVEAEGVFEEIATLLPGRAVVAHGDMSARAVTGAWGRGGIPCVVIGTARVAAWPVFSLGLAVLVEEGRRALKDRQTPTVHARDLLRHRSRVERFPLVTTGPVPTVETIAAGTDTRRVSPGRLWPLVEVVDRGAEPTGGGILTDTAKRAIAAVTRRGGSSFVFGHRRGYAAATRCVGCRTIRRCASCGSRPDPGESCSRCGAPLGPCTECGLGRFEALGAGVGRAIAEVGRIVGAEQVTPMPGDGPVVVGTEKDLTGLDRVDLAVLPDFDGLLYGTNFRAAEDALRLGARVAGIVARRSGARLLVQTSTPDHHIVKALVAADPVPAIQAEARDRIAMGYPPGGQLAVIEVTGDEVPDLGALEGLAAVLGPVDRRGAHRFLLHADDLGRAKAALRPMVQRWRDSGLHVRVDADPIDL